MSAATVVLVEGDSDARAVTTLARRLGRDLAADGVDVVAMGGATNVGRFLARYGPSRAERRLVGLCDVREAPYFARVLEQFFVCDADLEDELIRALGVAAVEAVAEQAGELGSLRALQQQPAQRNRSPEAQLRRFMGSRGGRKIRYASLLVDALELDRVPTPLVQLLAAV
jgi:hypothetical protein